MDEAPLFARRAVDLKILDTAQYRCQALAADSCSYSSLLSCYVYSNKEMHGLLPPHICQQLDTFTGMRHWQRQQLTWTAKGRHQSVYP
jgi:hypothetical protein